MKTSYGNRFVGPILAVSLLFSTALHAGQLDKQGPITPPSQSGAQSTQAISQTGLLPVYGVDLRLDPGWVDQKQFPSSSVSFPNSGTSSTLQQVWTALQPGGYNVLRIPLDVRDAGAAANRAANLCLWAKNNNVQLILVLSDSDSGQPIGQDFPAQAATFVKTLVTLLRGNNGQYLPNYSQVMAFQLEDELNHVGKHGGMAAAVAQQLALQVAKSLRQSEKDALNGTGTAATPLMVSASFDFELIQLGAIAGGTMSDVDYNQAYQSLKQFLSGLSSSADLDLITVDWFAGSLSSGGIDKAPVLLKSLLTDISGKQIVFSAGFSTAFRSADEQKRLFATAFSNLTDLRASNGADCPFVGAIFREALNGKNASATPPRATLPAEMAKWDWKARAAELMALWTQKKKSDDMSWWLAKVENTMGIVSLQNDVSGKTAAAAASPAQQGMTQIASAVSDVNAQMAAAATPNPSAYASGFQSGATVLGTTAGQGTPATNYSAPQTSLPPQPNMAGAGAYGQPGCSNASTYLNTTPNPYGASPYGQTYNQPYSQPNNQPYGQQLNQPYGQQYGMPGTAGVNCGSSILAQSLQGEAQKGMLGLLDGVLQRLGSLTGGSSLGNGYNTYGSGYNTYGNTGSTTNPYNYNNNNGANSYNPGGQTPTNSGGQTGGYNGQQVSVPAGAVQVGQQDISLQPLKPQAGTPEIITVNLHNQSSTDVYGLVLQATGSDGSALQQQGGLHLAPNASTPVAIPWVPPNANSSYSITVNVSDGSGNQLASAQMTPVAIAAAASNEGGGNGTNGGSGSNGGSGGSGGTGTTGGGGSGGTSGGSGGGSTSCTNSGATNNPAGAVTVASIQLGTAGQPVVAGQAASVVVSLSNPNSVSLTNIAGSLCVDGNPSQNQSLSSLMPQQSRSLVFQGVILAQAGQHQVSVSVASQGANAQMLTASLTQQVTVAAATSGGTTTGGVRKISTTLPNAGGEQPPGPRGLSANVRSVTPPSYQIGHLVIPNRPGAQSSILPPSNLGVGMPPSGSVSQTKIPLVQKAEGSKGVVGLSTPTSGGALPPPPARPGVALPPAMGRPGSVGTPGSSGLQTAGSGCSVSLPGGLVDLSVNGPGVLAMSPAQSRPGQAVTFVIKVSNPGAAQLQGSTAIFSLFADGQKISESPRLAFAPPNQACVEWPTTLPMKGQTVEVKAVVLGNNALNGAAAKVSMSFAARVR